MEKLFISELKEKQTIHSHFLVKNKNLLTDKKGNPYLSLHLSDRSGTLDAKIWDNVEEINPIFDSGDIVLVKGQVKSFQNRKQVVIRKLERVENEEFDLKDYVPSTEIAPEEIFKKLLKIVDQVQSEPIKQLILSTLKDPLIQEKLLKSPAAKSIHHVKQGGLIEHILSVSQIMVFIAQHYPHLNFDWLVFGAIFHDLGKIWELEWTNQGIRYTDQGRLVGHLVMSAELVEKKASQILGFPPEQIMVLKHIILSHHGRLEYGSPKVPMCLEAYVVWMVDDLDSKVDSIHRFIQQDHSADEQWTSYSSLYQRHFLKGLPQR